MEEQVQETQQMPQLTLNDMAALANIINVASKRGAFNANELSSVGSVYDKLNAFVTAAQAAQTQQEVGSEQQENSSEETQS